MPRGPPRCSRGPQCLRAPAVLALREANIAVPPAPKDARATRLTSPTLAPVCARVGVLGLEVVVAGVLGLVVGFGGVVVVETTGVDGCVVGVTGGTTGGATTGGGTTGCVTTQPPASSPFQAVIRS